VLQLALALLLFMRRDPLAGVTSVTLLLPPDAVRNVDHLVIEAKGGAGAAGPAAAPGAPAGEPTRIDLVKKNGAWVLPGSFDAPAEGSKVSALLDRLAAIKRGLPIATSEAALKRFKVVDEDFERRLVLSAGEKPLATVYFGSSPGLRKSDARLSVDKAVYSVDLPTYELPTDSGAWLSGELLQGDTAKLAEIDITNGAATGLVSGRMQLVRTRGTDKQADSWADPALTGEQRVDSARAESLLQQLRQLHVDAVLGPVPKPEWQQDRPILSLALKDEASHEVHWTLSKPQSGDFYVLKSSSQPWFFSLSASAGPSLMDSAARDTLIASPKAAPAAVGAAPKPAPRPAGKS
jgi:Domain of unknown function (DUF4340)